MLPVLRAGPAPDQAPRAKASDDPAQMRLVHPERSTDGGGRSALPLSVCQFVEDARFRQGQVAGGQMPVQQADLAGVKPVEGADLVDERHGKDGPMCCLRQHSGSRGQEKGASAGRGLPNSHKSHSQPFSWSCAAGWAGTTRRCKGWPRRREIRTPLSDAFVCSDSVDFRVLRGETFVTTKNSKLHESIRFQPFVRASNRDFKRG